MCVCEYFFVCIPVWSRNAPLFLECPHISSPAWSLPCLPWCSPQPANKQKKIRVKYFCWQLIAPVLSDIYLSTRSSSLETISCCETLAYFKYTPVKAKIKIITSTNFFCYLQSRSHFHANKLLKDIRSAVPRNNFLKMFIYIYMNILDNTCNRMQNPK
jgi:hypothetical protein